MGGAAGGKYKIRPSTLNRLRKKFGPQEKEGMCRILRHGEPTRSGAGWLAGTDSSIGPMACSVIFLPNVAATEKLVAGEVKAEAQIILALPAAILVTTSDVYELLAWPWQAGKLYVPGQSVVPVEEDGNLYAATVPGKAGSSEPTWETDQGELTTDGGSIWLNKGPYIKLQAIQLMEPRTYGSFISTKILCRYFEQVAP